MTNAQTHESFASSHLTRRNFFRFGATVVAGVAVAGTNLIAAEDAMAAEFTGNLERMVGQIGGARRLAFKNTHTGEELTTTFWNGGYQSSAIGQINHILRDFRTGEVHPINTGLLNLLTVLGHRMGAHAPVNIISGYRSPKTNAMLRSSREGGVAKRSFHMRGMAIDIRIPGVSTARIAQEARRLGVGGVGYYPESDFVHVDVGPVRTW